MLGAAIVAACLIAAYVAFQRSFGFSVHWTTIVFILLIAYIVMVPRSLAFRAALGRRRFGLDVPLSDWRVTERRMLTLPRARLRRSRLVGAVGLVALFALITVLAILDGGDLVMFWFRIHHTSAHLVLATLLGWLTGRAVYLSLTASSSLPRPGSDDVDLLDLDDVHAFGRAGLHAALAWLVGMAIGGLLFLGTDLGLWGVIPVFLIGLAIGLVVLMQPARAVRRLVDDAKRKEIARLAPLLRQAREEALTGAEPAPGRLADLLAYDGRVRSMPEWPFDSSTIWRFALYLLLPVGSMVGGALVERVVDLVLG